MFLPVLSLSGRVGPPARNLMTVKILTMTSPDNVSGKSVSIKWLKLEELEQAGESGPYSLIVSGFSVNLTALNLISRHFIGTKLHYGLVSSLSALHLCQTKACLRLMLVSGFGTRERTGISKMEIREGPFLVEEPFIHVGLLCQASEERVIHGFFPSVGHSAIRSRVCTRQLWSRWQKLSQYIWKYKHLFGNHANHESRLG